MAKKLGTDYSFDYRSKGLSGWHPAIEDALVSVSDDCLELNTHFLLNISRSILTVSWFCIPGALAFIYYFFPVIAESDFLSEFERYRSGILTLEDILLAPVLPLVGIAIVLVPIIFVYVRRRNSTFLFNRKTQKVHAMIGGKHYFSDWKDLQFQFVTIKSWSGYTVILNDGIRFYLKDKKNKIKKIEVEGGGPVEDGMSNRLLNWDFIKKFMDQSDDRSTLSFPGVGVMYLYQKTNPFFTPKETFRQWWPFPYKKIEFDFGNERLRLYNFVKRLLLFPIAIPGDLLWYGLMKLLPGKMKVLPLEGEERCIGKRYTKEDIVRGQYPSFVNPNIPRVPEE